MVLTRPPLLLGVISTLAGMIFDIYVPDSEEGEYIELTESEAKGYQMLSYFTNILRTLCVAVIASLFIMPGSMQTAIILTFMYNLAYLLTYFYLRECDLIPEGGDDEEE